jgi:hypothetical protein
MLAVEKGLKDAGGKHCKTNEFDNLGKGHRY